MFGVNFDGIWLVVWNLKAKYLQKTSKGLEKPVKGTVF